MKMSSVRTGKGAGGPQARWLDRAKAGIDKRAAARSVPRGVSIRRSGTYGNQKAGEGTPKNG
jgi:hypothetical protein